MAYKLICLDMDGVIFKQINFWMELHKKFGTLEQGTILTKQYMHSDYQKLVEEVVVKLWKGKSSKPYYELVNSAQYLPGVDRALKQIKNKGLITAIISASSMDLARRVQKDYGIDHIYANELIIVDNKVSGEFVWPLGAGREKKAEIIRGLCSELGISLAEVIYIGDGDTDIEAFKIVGLSIAFNSSSAELRQVASHVVDSSNLADVLQFIP